MLKTDNIKATLLHPLFKNASYLNESPAMKHISIEELASELNIENGESTSFSRLVRKVCMKWHGSKYPFRSYFFFHENEMRGTSYTLSLV